MSVASRGRWLRWVWNVATSPGSRLTAWLGLVVATGLLVRAEVSRPDTPEGVRLVSDLVYRESSGRRARLDVYLPMGTSPASGWPVLLAIHGGGWRGGDKGDYGRALAPLIRRGLAVVAIDYRLSRPGSPSWPENRDDVRAARFWIEAHVTEFGFDPARVAAIGASAGAHLALLCAVDDDSPPLRAVIDFYGPTDLPSLAQLGTGARLPIELMLGSQEPGFARRVEEASPVGRLRAGGPPVFIVHGEDDLLVPTSQSLKLVEALKRNGTAHRFVLLPKARHGFGLQPSARDLVPEILDFLEEAWRNPGAPAGS